jgi:hypothetical protein
VKELVETIARALVDNPDQVQVRAIEGEQLTVFELRVNARADVGRLHGAIALGSHHSTMLGVLRLWLCGTKQCLQRN